jgi:hypothetical protein
MKLRIKGNSIRLRLGRSEVQRLADEGIVEESTVFGPSRYERLLYAVAASQEALEVSVSFADQRLFVRVPERMIHRWSKTDQVGIEAVQRTGDEGEMQILIEKDFECAHAGADERQADTFANPQLEANCRPAGSLETLR